MKNFLEFIKNIILNQENFGIKKHSSKKLSFVKKDAMSKNIITSNASLTFSVELEKNKKKVREEVSKIAKENLNNLENILLYAKERGTKFYLIKNAKKLLSLIKDQPGFILPKKNFEALFINLLTEKRVSFKSNEMFIFENEKLTIYTVLYEFYKWYSYKMELPGFDEGTVLKVKNIDSLENSQSIENLSYEEIIKIKEAINRDKEAMEFVMSFMKEVEGAKNAFENLKDDGTSI